MSLPRMKEQLCSSVHTLLAMHSSSMCIVCATADTTLRHVQAVMVKEAANADFAFLFDVASSEHTYYRWRLWSLASGDSLKSWRVEPFAMVEGAARWAACPCAALPCGSVTAAQQWGLN